MLPHTSQDNPHKHHWNHFPQPFSKEVSKSGNVPAMFGDVPKCSLATYITLFSECVATVLGMFANVLKQFADVL